MWLLLGLAGAAGYYYFTRTEAAKAGLETTNGIQVFTPEQKTAILSNFPVLSLVQVTEVQGAKTFKLGPMFTGATSAGIVVTEAITNGMLVGASISLLNTNVEEHYVTIAFPTPGMAETIAGSGSPLALLFDPANPEF